MNHIIIIILTFCYFKIISFYQNENELFCCGEGRKRGENNVVLTLLQLTLKCTGTWREEILKRIWFWSSWNAGPGSSAFQSITRTLQSSAALCSSTICMYFHRNHLAVKQAGQIFLLI